MVVCVKLGSTRGTISRLNSRFAGESVYPSAPYTPRSTTAAAVKGVKSPADLAVLKESTLEFVETIL